MAYRNDIELINAVKLNLIINSDEDNDLIDMYITAAIDYAEKYQHIVAGYYSQNKLPPTTAQAVVMLASFLYESRTGGTGGFFADSVTAAQNTWNAVNLLLRLDRDWQV